MIKNKNNNNKVCVLSGTNRKAVKVMSKVKLKYDIFEKKHQRKLEKIIDALQLKPLIKVKIRNTGKLSNGVKGYCHNNVMELASKLGGKVVTGYSVRRVNDLNQTYLFSHSVWLSPENKYVCVTYSNQFEDEYFDFYPYKIYDPKEELHITQRNFVISDNAHEPVKVIDDYGIVAETLPLNFFTKVKRLVKNGFIKNYSVVSSTDTNISNNRVFLDWKLTYPNPFNLKKSFVSYQAESDAV